MHLRASKSVGKIECKRLVMCRGRGCPHRCCAPASPRLRRCRRRGNSARPAGACKGNRTTNKSTKHTHIGIPRGGIKSAQGAWNRFRALSLDCGLEDILRRTCAQTAPCRPRCRRTYVPKPCTTEIYLHYLCAHHQIRAGAPEHAPLVLDVLRDLHRVIARARARHAHLGLHVLGEGVAPSVLLKASSRPVRKPCMTDIYLQFRCARSLPGGGRRY